MERPYYNYGNKQFAIEFMDYRKDGSIRGIQVLEPEAPVTRKILNTEPPGIFTSTFNRLALCDPEIENHITWEEDNTHPHLYTSPTQIDHIWDGLSGICYTKEYARQDDIHVSFSPDKYRIKEILSSPGFYRVKRMEDN